MTTTSLQSQGRTGAPGQNRVALAQQTKAIERKRESDTGANLLRLALARGPVGLSLSQTAAWATMLGLAE